MLVPFILRKIRKSKWYKHERVPWLAEGELQADALGDLQTSNNELSVWQVEDDRSNLERIITALAANSDHISNLDYALFDAQVLLELNIQSKHSRGNTPDEEANVWHLDLIQLSAQKLMKLAKAIMTDGEKVRFLPKELLQSIRQAMTSGQIDRAKLKQDVLVKVDGRSANR